VVLLGLRRDPADRRLAIAGKGINFGIDFESGTRITAPLEQRASPAQVRERARRRRPARRADPDRQNPELGSNVVQISTRPCGPESVTRVNEELRSEFGLADRPNVEAIGPTFGQSVARSAPSPSSRRS
jgi:SecD/SecF fusion protein